VLRWALEKGVSVIPKSYNAKRMVENLQVFCWRLTLADHERIEQIEQKKNMDASFFCTPHGPYKTVEEFWDGEI
jgi:diketogulonate reductase-like aldo/keto reductase